LEESESLTPGAAMRRAGFIVTIYNRFPYILLLSAAMKGTRVPAPNLPVWPLLIEAACEV
jgi:hypothetical protein